MSDWSEWLWAPKELKTAESTNVNEQEALPTNSGWISALLFIPKLIWAGVIWMISKMWFTSSRREENKKNRFKKALQHEYSRSETSEENGRSLSFSSHGHGAKSPVDREKAMLLIAAVSIANMFIEENNEVLSPAFLAEFTLSLSTNPVIRCLDISHYCFSASPRWELFQDFLYDLLSCNYQITRIQFSTEDEATIPDQIIDCVRLNQQLAIAAKITNELITLSEEAVKSGLTKQNVGEFFVSSFEANLNHRHQTTERLMDIIKESFSRDDVNFKFNEVVVASTLRNKTELEALMALVDNMKESLSNKLTGIQNAIILNRPSPVSSAAPLQQKSNWSFWRSRTTHSSSPPPIVRETEEEKNSITYLEDPYLETGPTDTFKRAQLDIEMERIDLLWNQWLKINSNPTNEDYFVSASEKITMQEEIYSQICYRGLMASFLVDRPCLMQKIVFFHPDHNDDSHAEKISRLLNGEIKTWFQNKKTFSSIRKEYEDKFRMHLSVRRDPYVKMLKADMTESEAILIQSYPEMEEYFAGKTDYPDSIEGYRDFIDSVPGLYDRMEQMREQKRLTSLQTMSTAVNTDFECATIPPSEDGGLIVTKRSALEEESKCSEWSAAKGQPHTATAAEAGYFKTNQASSDESAVSSEQPKPSGKKGN